MICKNFYSIYVAQFSYVLPMLLIQDLGDNTKFVFFFKCAFDLDRVSVPSPIAVEILMDAMARDRAHMYLFSV